jgi:Uma2 family endonuclease
MTTIRKLTFEEYLTLDHDDGLPEGRCEFIDGEWVELPPESGLNDTIANYLFLLLVKAGIPFELIRPGKCELQVPVLQKGDAANRFPDLVILRKEHMPLVQQRLTITMVMPPPVLVVEVVSPGKANRKRDYQRKREQYARLGVPEYWLIDPEQQVVMVLRLDTGRYVEVGTFQGGDRLTSLIFPELQLTVEQIFAIGQ